MMMKTRSIFWSEKKLLFAQIKISYLPAGSGLKMEISWLFVNVCLHACVTNCVGKPRKSLTQFSTILETTPGSNAVALTFFRRYKCSN